MVTTALAALRDYSGHEALRAQVTDMDGTLVDGEVMVLSTDFQLLGELLDTLTPPVPYRDFNDFCQVVGGKSYGQILDITLHRLKLSPLDESVRSDLIQQEQEKVIGQIAAGNLKGCPYAADVIREMIEAGAYVCISSSSTRPRLQASLEALDLHDLFPAEKIVSGQSDFAPPRPKPFPDCFLRSTRKLLIERPQASVILGIEDSVGGITGSQAAAKELRTEGVNFHTVWYTGVTPPALQDAWRPTVRKQGTQFEVNDWRHMPELHDLLLQGDVETAAKHFGLKS